MVAKTAAKLIASVEVTLGTHKAEVLYAGTSPGSIFGLTQVNFVVPPDLKFGGPLPVVVRVDGMTTQVADAFQGAVTLSAMGPSAPVPGTPKYLSANTTVDGGLATLKWTPADDLAALYYIEKHAGPACTSFCKAVAGRSQVT